MNTHQEMRSAKPSRSARRFADTLARLLACMLLLLPAAALAQLPCDGGGGDPGGCEGGVASQAGGAGGGTAVGSTTPIHFFTGNKYLREVDLPALPGPLGLEIVRHYNSQDAARAGLTGRGWRLSYETDLKVEGRLITLTQADGRRLHFIRDRRDPDRYRHPDPLRGEIRREGTAQAARYRWHWPDGRTLSFNWLGQLEEIRLSSGEFLRLTYGPGYELMSVTDPQGRSLILRWAGKDAAWRGVTALSTPVGVFRYEHAPGGAQRGTLTQVRAPDGALARDYHYEDARHPAHLTGITLKGTDAAGRPLLQRLATYAYDAHGRAVSSAQGEGAAGLRVTYVAEGHTRVTNALGQASDYRGEVLDGAWRLTEARGPGCAACPAPNMRYEWDVHGRLMARIALDAAGRPLERTGFTRDGRGRVVERTRQVRHAGRWSPPQRLVRYAFEADAVQPALVARPSVVPGREHVLRLAYNAAGQPIEVAEHGWRPALGTEAPQPLARTLRFAYGAVNAATLPVALDGPLPNGATARPADSDVTVREYDPQSRLLQAVTVPGGMTTRVIARDAALRPTVVHMGDGARMVETRIQYTYYGAPTRVEELAWILKGGKSDPASRLSSAYEYRYDAEHRLIEHGERRGAEFRPEVRSEYDAAGRLAWTAHSLGILQRYGYDAEGRLLEAWHADSRMAQVWRYAYDGSGRPTQFSDAGGAQWAIGYDEHGHPKTLTDALGRTHALDQTASGDTTGIRRVVDDFGRVVAILSPDAGTTTHWFDAADRLTGSIDGEGHRAAYEFDAAGRIVRQTITDRRSGKASVTVWRYRGQRLAALEHPAQSEHYRHDARGRRIARTVTIRRADGTETRSVTRYAYGEDGALHSVSLPDGSRLEYERNGQGQVVALKRRRVQTAWLQWLLPARTIVSGLQRDLVGLQHYRAGNGIEADYQRSHAGTLARIVYRGGEASAGTMTAGALDRLSAPAYASQTPDPAAGPPPGALGLPPEPNALLDLRYLWDAQGNLLHLQQRAGAAAAGSYAYDRDDRLIAAVHSARDSTRTSRYFYDRQGRRLLSQHGIADQGDLRTNTLKALYQPGTHRWLGEATRETAYDANGQPAYVGVRGYRWDALGRLLEVHEGGSTLARYAYNHRGERIAKEGGEYAYYLYRDGRLAAELDAKGRLLRQYLYLADAPIAVIDSPRGKLPEGEARDAWSRIRHDLATIVQAWFGDDEATTWLHVNHLGAVEAATDRDGKPVWRAHYRPSGEAAVAASHFALNLRLPGQYFDAETGLHYNGRRYYDPHRGEYLTPDPLGAPDGPNPYSYVRGNPLRYVDPSGLILFAFDGTDNTNDLAWLAARDSSVSNVVRFRDLYRSDNGRYRYITGVGTVDRSDPDRPILAPNKAIGPVPRPDKGFNWSGPERIARMVEYFVDEAELAKDDSIAMDVDIIGFSRGAAQARDFANRIVANTTNGWYRYVVKENGVEIPKCQKVNFRFMGLWDTVLSTNYSGYSYQMGIPAEFSYVAQAVALNEFRGNTVPDGRPFPSELDSWGAFPLESVMGGALPAGQTRIERGFIGAHADIGGSFGDGENQLAQVALAWMVRQAELAGVKMDARTSTVIANPVLHDKSSNIQTGRPATESTTEDRTVRYRDGATTRQRQMTDLGMSYADTGQFINYTDRSLLPRNVYSDVDPLGNPVERIEYLSNRTGTVDMNGYLQWLRTNGYDLGKLTVQ